MGLFGMVLGQPEEISCFRYPTFFQKRQKEKEKRGRGFQMASCSYALFFATPVSSKERWAWPRHTTPTDRPAVERDSRDTGNKVFLLVGLRGLEKIEPDSYVETTVAKIAAVISWKIQEGTKEERAAAAHSVIAA